MSLRNHVVWQDGLFIKPHHFQQQQRYFEHLVRTKTENIQHYLEKNYRKRLDLSKITEYLPTLAVSCTAL